MTRDEARAHVATLEQSVKAVERKFTRRTSQRTGAVLRQQIRDLHAQIAKTWLAVRD